MAGKPWERWGRELRRLRDAQGLSQTELGDRIHVSKSMISGFERGTRKPKSEHAEALDSTLATGGVLARFRDELVRQGDGDHWWADIGLLEQDAVFIREYQLAMVPGLLQTEEYARQTMRLGRPWDRTENIERDVAARLARIDALREDVSLWFVVEELSLRRVVGDRQAMARQLDSILTKCAEDERMRGFQVIPHHAPRPPGWSGPMRILELPQRAPVALVEHLLGEEIADATEPVRRCNVLFGALQAAALGPAESEVLMKQIKREYDDAA